MAAISITTGKFVRHGARLALVLGSLFLSLGAARAQEDPLRTVPPREALSVAIDLFKSQSYEKAATYFTQAQAGQKSLTAAEVKDLTDFSSQNAIALRGRMDAADQLRLTEDALKEGRLSAAGNLLKSLNANQYLNTADRHKLAGLNRSWQAKSNQASQPQEGKADAKALLASGRAALQMGDVDAAESFANQADKASSVVPAWLQPWSDSPAKLRRDIRSAQEKLAPAVKPAPADPDAGKTSNTGFKFPSLWPFGGGTSEPAKKDAAVSADRKIDEQIARQALKDGFIFLEANDLDKAKFIAMKVKEMNVTFGPDEKTPDILLHEIQRRTGGAAATLPDPKTAKTKTPTAPPSNDAHGLVKHGRLLLAQKKYDEADKVCSQAQATPARWGLFEDNPDRLRRDLQSARQTFERDESVKLVVDARKLLAQGSLDEAEQKAFKAKRLHGPYGVFDFGERPDKLLEEIHHARQAKGLPSPGEQKDVAKETPGNVGGMMPVPASVQNANKNRAIVLVREARELERKEMLLEARQKAFEARALRAAFLPEEDSPEAVLSSLFARCDRQIVTHLQHAAAVVGDAGDAQRFEKAQAKLLEARKLAQTFELDTGRIEQAAHYVQQVAQGGAPLQAQTQLPLGVGSNPLLIGQTIDVPTGDPKKDALRKHAREKLKHAQLELAAGKTAQARQMAMDLYDPQFGIQQEVLALIRSISAEEYNQQVLQSKRTFDAGLDAFLAKDYRKAMSIFQAIDTLMLPEQYQLRLRDIMSTREMGPHAVAQAQYKTDKQFIPGAKITENKDPSTPGAAEKENLIAQHNALELVQIQQLRQRGQEAMRTAAEMFKNKQRDEAIQTLKHHIEQINLASLDPQKANELRRFPEQRIQQYQAVMADETMNSLAKNKYLTSFHDESKRQEDIRTHQTEIMEKMKLVHELLKQNKLKEASVEVKKIREIDPDNVAAIAADHIITTRVNQKKYDDAMHRNGQDLLDQLDPTLKANLTPENPIEFSRDMIQRRKTTDGSIVHPLSNPKERAIQYRLKQPISLHFKDVPLRQAIQDLTVQSGVQVVADERALDEARVNLDSPLSISVDNIDMKSALNLMLNKLKLSYTIQNQVLMITTETETSGRLVRITYPIADLIVAVEDHPLPDVLNIQVAIERSMNPSANYSNSYMVAPPYMNNPGAPVSSHSNGLGSAYASQGKGAQGMGGAGTPPKDRSKDGMAEVLKDLIVKTIAKSKWEDMGGNGSIQYFPMGMALVINQTQEVQEEVQLLLATLRKLQDLQVSVELRAVLVSETFFERIGVDFDLNIRTPTNRTEPNLLAGTFVPAPFLNRTGAGLNGLISGLTSAGTLTPDLNVPIRNSTFNFTTPQFGGYQPEAGLSLGLAFLSDIQVFMFLEAVQGDRRAHIMQAPKLTVFNGQLATISGQMVRPTVQNLFPAPLANGTIIMIPQITAMPFGLTMTVQPVVSPDRRFIRLNVTPILANGVQDPAAAILFAIPNFTNPTFDGGIPQPPLVNQQLGVTIQPTTTNLFLANTTVNVPDGGTVLLGGFKFLAEERTEYGPPILSKIPYLSRLFRNVGWSRDGSTLIYLVTARVIMVEEEERIFLGELPPISGR